MRKSLFISSFLLIYLNSFSQHNYIPFALENTSWKTSVDLDFFPCYHSNYYYYKTVGDTSLFGNDYSIIKSTTFFDLLLREDSGLVYCRLIIDKKVDSTEFVLYNFTAKKGDTLLLPSFESTLGYYNGIVTEVDSILIGSVYHKRIWINSWIGFRFIEGIGAMQGLFYPQIPWVDYGGQLLCFSRNDTIFEMEGSGSFRDGNCWDLVGVEDFSESEVSLFPNPTSKYIEIQNITAEFNEVSIIDMSGNRLMTLNRGNYNSRIDVSMLPAGVYHLIISRNNRELSIREKFVKE